MADVRRFLSELRDRLSASANESELRAGFVAACEHGLGLRGFQLERGRADLRHGAVVIEFKKRGFFRRSSRSAKFREAYDQLTVDYLPALARRERSPLPEYLGVLCDGESLSFVMFDRDNPSSHRHTGLHAMDERGAELVALALERSRRRTFTSEHLCDDFGPGRPACNALLAALWTELRAGLARRGSRVHMLYAEWQELFAQATELGRLSRAEIGRHLEDCGLPVDGDHTEILFVLHTYNSILFKLLAAEVLCSVRYRDDSGVCARLAATGNAELWPRLASEIEDGGLFRDRHIRNFVEGTYFSWYLERPSGALGDAVRAVCRAIALYRMPTASHETHDVIQDLYQELLPKALRHSIGEFYTPHWLVEHTLDRAGYLGPAILDGRVLDPTCGSGTFLVVAIRRYRQEAARRGVANGALRAGILSHVFGFDLNPLATLASRLNYLLAIHDLLDDDVDIEIPVYLADAVYAPWRSDGDVGEGGALRSYTLPTRLGPIALALPEALVADRAAFDRVLELCDHDAEAHIDEAGFAAHLDRELRDVRTRDRWRPHVVALYRQILSLAERSWDGIWSRIIRNYFASATLGQVRWVVGNPPWIRWSELPETYRERVKRTCQRYAIFSSTPFFGGNELDLSAIVTYSASEKWLEPGGTLAFVIPQTHFQAPSSEGFRAFQLPDGTPLGVRSVDDWSAVRPFDGVANKPSTLVLEKGAPTRYPMTRYHVWTRRARVRIASSSSWREAEPLLAVETRAAKALPPDGRWAIVDAASDDGLTAIAGADPHHRGRKGVTCDLNGAYFVSVVRAANGDGLVRVRNDATDPRTKVPIREFDVEGDLLHPLLKGAGEFSAFSVERRDRYVIVPNRRITDIEGADAFAAAHRHAYRHFTLVDAPPRRLLSSRSTYRTRMLATGAPFYAIYNVGAYTFAPFKVVWAEQSSRLVAAVVGDADVPGVGRKAVVPDHKVYFVPFAEEEAAHFLCALLNAPSVAAAIDSFTVKLQVGTLFRHIQLPAFAPADARHRSLAALSMDAHAGRRAVDLAALDRDARAVLPRGARAGTTFPGACR